MPTPSAFYLKGKGDAGGAVDTLEGLLRRAPAYVEATLLLGEIREERGEREKARSVYRRALEQDGIQPRHRALLNRKAESLELK